MKKRIRTRQKPSVLEYVSGDPVVFFGLIITACLIVALVMLLLFGGSTGATGKNESLGIEDVSSDEYDAMLSGDGIPIAKVSGEWTQYTTESSTLCVVVNVRTQGVIVQRLFICKYPVIIVNDVTDDSEAKMTYSSDDGYSYVLHIPADAVNE